MQNWKFTTLSNVANIVPGYAFKGNDFGKTGTPIIKIKDIIPPYIDIKNADRIDISKYKNIENFILVKNDIVVAMTGATIGKVGRYTYNNIAYLNQRVAKILPKKDIINNFLYYCVSSLSFHQHIQNNIDSNSAQENISASSIGRFSFFLPPLAEQKAIAAVLSSLDDKIDLLHRQNATLERMAETLFRQWFIEEAQEGWDIKPLTYIANFLNGLACQKFPPQNDIDKLPVLKIRELNNGISEDSDFASSCVGQEYIIHAGDVIFSWSGSLLVKIWHGEDCILNQHLFKVYSSSFPKWFYYFWCKHHLLEFSLIAESHATTMGHIKRRDLEDAEVLVPDRGTLENMTKVIAPLFEKLLANTKQIRTLEKLRDTLLPKLMSGEVRVRVAE